MDSCFPHESNDHTTDIPVLYGLKGLFKHWNGLRKAVSNFDFILYFQKRQEGTERQSVINSPTEAQQGQNQTSLTPGSSKWLGSYNA